jgi:hypothetical protein
LSAIETTSREIQPALQRHLHRSCACEGVGLLTKRALAIMQSK